MKNMKNVMITVLAVLVVAMGALLYVTNADKGKLSDTNIGLAAQVTSLEAQVSTLKVEAAQSAETAKAELDKAIQTAEAAKTELDEAVKARDEAEAALQAVWEEASKTAQPIAIFRLSAKGTDGVMKPVPFRLVE